MKTPQWKVSGRSISTVRVVCRLLSAGLGSAVGEWNLEVLLTTICQNHSEDGGGGVCVLCGSLHVESTGHMGESTAAVSLSTVLTALTSVIFSF